MNTSLLKLIYVVICLVMRKAIGGIESEYLVIKIDLRSNKLGDEGKKAIGGHRNEYQ